MSTKKRIAVIGAGVSGLVTAKTFLSRHHDVVVFEKTPDLGGVWAPPRRYPGLRLQTSRDSYAFSDFPMPPGFPEFPSGEQIHGYLEAYAEHHRIRSHILFDAEVKALSKRPDGRPGWQLRVYVAPEEQERTFDFDFVVACNGVFSEPATLDIPGRQDFVNAGGRVLHAAAFRSLSEVAGRNVVVIGFGKSGLDIAEAAETSAASTTVVCRRIPWKVPHRIFRANIKHLILSRFTELWFPTPEMTGWRRILHTWLKPLVSIYWAAAERIILHRLGLKGADLRPDIRLSEAGPCVTLAVDNLRALRERRVQLRRGSPQRFVASGIELASGETVAADVVVLATGYQQKLSFLPDDVLARLYDSERRILLFRTVINPRVPDLAFNGYNGVGSSQLAAEVAACWLARVVEGVIRLPSPDEMMQSIGDEIALRERLLSARVPGGYYVSPFTMRYLDQLLGDMGFPPADRDKPLFRWLFSPLDPRDYRDVLCR